MRHFVYTTLSNSHKYTNWTRPSDPTMGPEIIPDPVMINGGANIATSPESERGRHTPKGVRTEVTEQQLAYLEQNSVFQKHKKQGFVTVATSAEDPDTVARDMTKRDHSAPLTPQSPELNKPEGPRPDDVGIVKKALNKLGDMLE